MCKELRGSRGYKKEQPRQANEMSETSLSNQKLQTTLLQTIMLKIVHSVKTELMRVLLDSGSQSSYLRKYIMKRLGLIPLYQETLSHNLFRENDTEFQAHDIFDIEIQNMGEEFKYKLSVLDKDKICAYIPRVKSKHVRSALRKRKINVNDSGKDIPDIGLFMGADYSR